MVTHEEVICLRLEGVRVFDVQRAIAGELHHLNCAVKQCGVLGGHTAASECFHVLVQLLLCFLVGGRLVHTKSLVYTESWSTQRVGLHRELVCTIHSHNLHTAQQHKSGMSDDSFFCEEDYDCTPCEVCHEMKVCKAYAGGKEHVCPDFHVDPEKMLKCGVCTGKTDGDGSRRCRHEGCDSGALCAACIRDGRVLLVQRKYMGELEAFCEKHFKSCGKCGQKTALEDLDDCDTCAAEYCTSCACMEFNCCGYCAGDL